MARGRAVASGRAKARSAFQASVGVRRGRWDAERQRLALALPHDRGRHRFARLEARENSQRVLGALRLAARELDDDVAIAEAELGGTARAHDEQTLLDAEVLP